MTKDQESGDTHTIWNANKVSIKRKKNEGRSFIIKKEKPVCMSDEEGWTYTKKNLLKACLVDNRTRDNYQRIYQYNQ